ncbi:hypothetical protein CCY99_04380 [Helicobacter sp. 16-1353]|uniref:asparaginase domain-containing protein n=1 Tax=Helicobacter sp. 16-1353 TaxID=2004996 RepID=UPI000DCD96AF|nr:asparaginase domain-containing protein [Helicobacter sp. 16-1353]RAX54254.1 hypothetical protein CCY99_04380 [Helicobacter sp. 16-1353]
MRILIISLGGTIGMKRDNKLNAGIPASDANDFIATLKSHSNMDLDITTKSFCNLPSGSLDFEILSEVIVYAKKSVDSGINAIIITQGTDTIEESSFFFNLFWDREETIIFCGAMRMEGEFAYDGIWNLSSSIAVASNLQSKNRGVLVVVGDRIFSANWIKKIHSTFIDAFDAIHLEGILIENKPRFFALPLKRMTFPLPKQHKKIMFLEQNLGENNEILDFVDLFDGIIINGFGSGHISAKSMDKIKSLNIPIIVASRTAFGFSTKWTYGYKGSEIDLQNNGAIMSGILDARRARILLWCILGNDFDLSKFNEFEESIAIS